MIKRRIIPLIAFLLLIVASPDARADVVKLGTIAPKGSPWHELMQDLSEAWKEASQGQYSLRIYPGGVAGDEADMVRKMRIGQLHAAALSGVGMVFCPNPWTNRSFPTKAKSVKSQDPFKCRQWRSGRSSG